MKLIKQLAIRLGEQTTLAKSLVMTRNLVVAVALMASGAALAEAELGKDYTLVNPPQPTETKKIEVLEFFFYGCIHCFHLDPKLTAWKKTMPKDVQLIYVPTVFRDSWEPMARTYFALDSMGQEPQLHDALFKTWNVDNTPLLDEAAIRDFVSSHGADGAKFSAAYNSFSVQSQVARSKQMIRSYGVDGTPTLIVDGKYRISGLLPDDTIRALKEVIVMARKEHQ
jgi:protein dithiol oxidoreductase (disulfide-forming)